MERLVVNHRSCRRYRKENVAPDIISRILKAMAAAPTGGNYCSVEYTVIDDKDRVEEIRGIVYRKVLSLFSDLFMAQCNSFLLLFIILHI